MKPIVIVLGLALGLAAAAPGAWSQPAPRAAAPCCRLPAGTRVTVELAEDVGAAAHKAGDTFALRLAEPVVVKGQIVLKAGAPGVGVVVEAAKPGMGGKAAKLVLSARSLKSPRGGDIPLKALQLSGVGQGHQSAATAVGIAGIAFAPLGVVGFAIHGGDVVLPAGTRASAKIAASVSLRGLGRAPRASVAAAAPDVAPAAIPIAPPPSGQGQVVFFRRKSILGVGQWFDVREDGAALGRLTNGAYFITPSRPGLHTYTSKTEPEFKDRLTLKIDAGETYFVEGVLTKGVVIGVADLTPSTAGAFQSAAADLKAGGAPDDTPARDAAEAR